MKKIILALVCIFAYIISYSQAPALQWQKCYGGSSFDGLFCIQNTNDGGYIIVGNTASSDGLISLNHGQGDALAIKIGETGNVEWQKCYGGTSNDIFYSVHPTTDGGYIMAGNTYSNDGDVMGNHGDYDGWVVKTNSTGTIEWQKCLGGTSLEELWSVQTTADGGYIIAGESHSNDGNVSGNHGNTDAWVVKLNSTGNLQWQKSYGGSNYDNVKSIKLTADGNYIMAGLTSSTNGDVSGNTGNWNAWTVKINTTGTILWQKCMGGNNDEYIKCIESTADGGSIITGFTNSNNGDVSANHGSYDAWVVKLNGIGSIEWQKCLGGTSDDYAYSIIPTNDGGYALSGYTNSTNGDALGNHGNNDAWIVKLDATGNLLWQKCVGGSDSDDANSILVEPDGSYIVAGQSYSNDGDVTENYGASDGWVVKINADYMRNTTFESNIVSLYPNPSSSVLNFQNSTNSLFDKIVVMDLTGKVILTKYKTKQLNIEHLVSGMYGFEAYLDGSVFSGKFVKE